MFWGQFLNDSEVDRSRDKDFRVIHVHMADEAVDTKLAREKSIKIKEKEMKDKILRNYTSGKSLK